MVKEFISDNNRRYEERVYKTQFRPHITWAANPLNI